MVDVVRAEVASVNRKSRQKLVSKTNLPGLNLGYLNVAIGFLCRVSVAGLRNTLHNRDLTVRMSHHFAKETLPIDNIGRWAPGPGSCYISHSRWVYLAPPT
jgi:hypothetical protein